MVKELGASPLALRPKTIQKIWAGEAGPAGFGAPPPVPTPTRLLSARPTTADCASAPRWPRSPPPSAVQSPQRGSAMVAGLFGCWFRVGGARPAGRVISVRPVSVPGEEASGPSGDRPFLLRPLPRRPGQSPAGGAGTGAARVRVLVCCARARLRVFLGVWVSVFLYAFVGGCRSVHPLVVCVCLLRIFLCACDFEGVY